MKYLIAVDLEGAHGVVGEPYTGLKPGMAEYDLAVRNVTEEVNAAIDALFDSGADEVFVWDNHGNLDNLDFSVVDGRAKKVKPQNNSTLRLEFLKGAGYDGMAFIGYHSREGAINGVLAHTYDSSAIQQFKIDEKPVGEYDIDGIIAESFGVPVMFLSSDDVCARDFSESFPDAKTSITKIGKGRNAAAFIDPATVLGDIRKGISEAVKTAKIRREKTFPCDIEIRYTRTETAAEKMKKLEEQGIKTAYAGDAHTIAGRAEDVYELRKYL